LSVTVANHQTEIEGRAHAMFERVLRIVNTRASGRRLHVWLTGPSGSGKSYLAAQVAKASGLPFYCTGAVSDKYSLVGFINAGDNGERNLMTEFRKAFEFGGVFAWDEIDASNPAALCAFNDALSNGRCSFPDRTVEQHADFVAIASANTWGNGATAEYVGRTRIDAATLNRFVRVGVEYDEHLERDLAGNHREWALFVQAVRRSVATNGLKVLITPRHTIQGAALLEAGLDRETVEHCTVFAGLDAATVDRIRLGA
jgi:MoxR-like ATPase